ncbi:MAG TPA: hypothetical protein VJ111_07755 [Chitinophagaceae bacterium]|nr:hypothetical protein [Chitinophagaceae bacterium]
MLFLKGLLFYISNTTMSKPLSKKINIFLSLEQDIFTGYFNPQDPAPLYKRQLSHEFELYIMTCIRSAKRNSEFAYKISYSNESDKQYAEPLCYAIRRHFSETKTIATATFERFKRKTYLLLFTSLAVVLVCQGFLPLLLPENEDHKLVSGLTNSLDVLCWVILWKPIERLIFYWNPFLKDISIMKRLEKAEIEITELEK